jgi:hypothetical protein
MKIPLSIIALGLMFLYEVAPARSQILSPADSSGIELLVKLAWTSAAVRGGDPDVISADIVLLPNRIIVSRYDQTPEAQDIQAGCGFDRTVQISPSDAQKFMECRRRAGAANTTLTHHAVMLPIEGGPRKCTETHLSSGSYRICAALVEKAADRLRMEYEEDTDHTGNLYAHRARFDITLLRDPRDRLDRILGCNVKTVAAFTFNPKRSNNLVPFDRATIERCGVGHW